MLGTQRSGQLGRRIAHRTTDSGRKDDFAGRKPGIHQRQIARQVSHRDAGGGGVLHIVGDEAQKVLGHRDPFGERSVFEDAEGAGEHHPRAVGKIGITTFDDTGAFVSQHQGCRA